MRLQTAAERSVQYQVPVHYDAPVVVPHQAVYTTGPEQFAPTAATANDNNINNASTTAASSLSTPVKIEHFSITVHSGTPHLHFLS